MDFKKELRVGVVLLGVVLLLFIGCANPLGGSGGSSGGSSTSNDTQTGTLRLALSGGVGASALVPDESREVAHYRISGFGPAGETFDPVTVDSNQSEVTVESLLIGTWQVAVEALNSQDSVVGRGVKEVEIIGGQETVATVSVSDLAVNGTLSLQLNGLSNGRTVNAKLFDGETGETLVMALAEGAAPQAEVWSGSWELSPGLYQLDLSVNDDGGEVPMGRYAVTIAGGLTTSGDFTYVPGTGSLSIQILDQTTGNTPFSVQLSDNSSLVTAQVDPVEGEYSYKWFVNNQIVPGAHGSTLDLASAGYTPGRFVVSVVVSAGAWHSSATAPVDLEPTIATIFDNGQRAKNEAFKFYMSAHLAADDRYLVAFNAQEMRFFDLTVPADGQWIKDLHVLWPGIRQPQAIASIGEYVYLVTTNGRLFVVDWTNRTNPVHLANIAIQGGQNFDLATNGVDALFVANTTNKSFQVISVANPAEPEIVFTDSVNGFGAGVAYYQGVAYATGFGGTLYAYEQVGGTWQRSASAPDGVPTLEGASRPAIIGDHLYVHKYSDKEFEIFSLANPATPVPVGMFTVDEKVSTYARLVQSGDLMYVGLGEANEAGELIVAYDVRNPANPVRDQQITSRLSSALLSEETAVPWPQGGLLGLTVMPGSGLLSVISADAEDSAIRMISILRDPA